MRNWWKNLVWWENTMTVKNSSYNIHSLHAKKQPTISWYGASIWKWKRSLLTSTWHHFALVCHDRRYLDLSLREMLITLNLNISFAIGRPLSRDSFYGTILPRIFPDNYFNLLRSLVAETRADESRCTSGDRHAVHPGTGQILGARSSQLRPGLFLKVWRCFAAVESVIYLEWLTACNVM